MISEAQPYPVKIKGELTEPLSRWLWIFKVLLLIPHYIILTFLWVASVLVWVVVLFAILFTGKYPRDLFDFSVGVLRWSWRVSFYGINAFGTDRYPPLTLKSVDYPADLEVEYPERLSRGLVLIKWWLLALPHYVIVTFFQGTKRFPGLIQILAFFAAVVLLFTGRYPNDLFSFIMGMNRWCLRVSGYVGLMTDRYPHFRLGG